MIAVEMSPVCPSNGAILFPDYLAVVKGENKLMISPPGGSGQEYAGPVDLVGQGTKGVARG